jgi:hypothetical protein
VECKSWSKPVGSEHVAWFLSKIENRGLDFGILLAMSGITGDARDKGQVHYEVAMALPKKIRIVVITRAEIEALSTTEELVVLIRRKVCQLAGYCWRIHVRAANRYTERAYTMTPHSPRCLRVPEAQSHR